MQAVSSELVSGGWALNSLLNREKTGNFHEINPESSIHMAYATEFSGFFPEFPKRHNREFFEPNREFSGRNREFAIPAFWHAKVSCHCSLAGQN